MGKRRSAVLAVLGVVGTLELVVGVLVWRQRAAKGRDPAAPSAGTSAQADEPSEPFARTTTTATAGPIVDRKRADEMREAIHRLLAEAGPPIGAVDGVPANRWNGPVSATGRPLAPMPKGGEVDDAGKEPLGHYIQGRVREDFMPLALQCYTSELAKNPKLAGKFVLKFRIVGDKRVGGVVDGSEIVDDKSDLKMPSFAQCMTESMMSVSFGAPPDGVPEISVEYPFLFSPDDEPDAGR